jgi:hypothetical protein
MLCALLQREPFCIVDFLIAEMEGSITVGLRSPQSMKRLPYLHYISYMQSEIDNNLRAPGRIA